jgi:2-oxoglutarate ferredoxin oxidoreductase subunit delta
MSRDPEPNSEKVMARGDAAAAAEPSQETPRKHFEIDIFPDWCKGCGICAAFCPKECIEQDPEGRPVIAAAWKCTGCRWCELHCPDFAICVREVTAKETAKEEAD